MPENAIQKSRCVEDQEYHDFCPGDLAVYPAHGVGRIESIESQDIGGHTQDFYFMNVFKNDMVIMIPTKNVESVGLRNVVSEEDISRIYEILQSKSDKVPTGKSWNYRHKTYMDMIRTGSLYEVAKVFRDLYLLRMSKELSFGERKILDMSQELLLKELSAAKDKDEKCVMTEIDGLFKDTKRDKNNQSGKSA
jgi:CarD family transcriptional regulator